MPKRSGARDDRKLDAIASYIARHPTRVVCTTDAAAWSREVDGRALGYVDPADPGTVHLGPYACEALRDPTSPLFGGRLHVLAHEAALARGIDDEAEAGCWGLCCRRTWLAASTASSSSPRDRLRSSTRAGASTS